MNKLYIDCYIKENLQFLINSYEVDSLDELFGTVENLLNPISGIEEIRIVRNTKGCSPYKAKKNKL